MSGWVGMYVIVSVCLGGVESLLFGWFGATGSEEERMKVPEPWPPPSSVTPSPPPPPNPSSQPTPCWNTYLSVSGWLHGGRLVSVT